MYQSTLNKKKGPLIIVDLDGTMIDFKRIDNAIIWELFSNNPFVMLFDRFLWWINSFDYISNCYFIFNLRVRLYSILSSKSKEEIEKHYSKRYIQMSSKEALEVYRDALRPIASDKYELMIVTNNVFAGELSKFLPVQSRKNKKKFISHDLTELYDIIYVIGNNYIDDIKSAYLIKAFPIYIGKSKLVKKLMSENGAVVESLGEAVEIVKRRG